MPKIILNVSVDVKELWVAAAHDERVSLSEWIRRAGEFRAGLPEREGGPGVPVPGLPESSYPRGSRPLPVSVREFRGPDPKKGK